ncbi:MAG: 30S ribosomal protein S15 [bacterium]
MTITREKKKEVIEAYKTNATDTGSPQVQVAILSERISGLTDHFKLHGKDHHSRRGLLKLVGKRKRLLNYMRENDLEAYRSLIDRLGLRK